MESVEFYAVVTKVITFLFICY